MSAGLATTWCELHRAGGEQEQACHILDAFAESRQPDPRTRRSNSVSGFVAVQRALGCMQVENISQAQQFLEAWAPQPHSPSLLEQVVLFRKTLILGKLRRYQGEFAKALTDLEYCSITRQATSGCRSRKRLTRSGLRACQHSHRAWLGDPQRAGRHLRHQFSRRERLAPGRQLSGRSFASLAEALFAQHQAAETACSTAKKLGNLRLSITRANLYQLRSDFVGAVQHWGDGIKLLGQFPSGTVNCLDTPGGGKRLGDIAG